MDGAAGAGPGGEWRLPSGAPVWQPPVRPPRPPANPAHRVACAWGAVVAFVSTVPASWWLIGDQSVRTRPPGELDYTWRAPVAPHWLATALGAVASILVVAIAGSFVGPARRGAIDRTWLGVLALALGAGFLLAGIARVDSAGTIGANIGGGMAIMFGLPLDAALIVWAVRRAMRMFGAPDAAAP
jgi:hypothetical protein